MKIKAESVEDYIAQAPEERIEALDALRKAINDNLPEGFVEGMGYGMPAWFVPHERYPAGYHADTSKPLPFMNFASQKNFVAFYHMGLYADEDLLDWFTTEYANRVSTKLDMGKSCVRFKKVETIPFDLIGELVAKVSCERWIEIYESSR